MKTLWYIDIKFLFVCRVMQAAIDITFPYLHTREAFNEKIGNFQVCYLIFFLLSFMLLDMWCQCAKQYEEASVFSQKEKKNRSAN